jgi:hypothetical protein
MPGSNMGLTSWGSPRRRASLAQIDTWEIFFPPAEVLVQNEPDRPAPVGVTYAPACTPASPREELPKWPK